MNLFNAFVASLLCAAALGVDFNWTSLTRHRGDMEAGYPVYQTTPDNITHIIWRKFTRDSKGFLYQVLYPNGTFASRGYTDLSAKIHTIFLTAFQVSDDGMHLLVIWDGRLSDSATRNNDEVGDKLKKTIFMESLNGGKTWSDPIYVTGTISDNTARYLPSTFFERDTGRVYVLYKRLQVTGEGVVAGCAVCVREPGMKKFEPEIILPKIEQFSYSHIGQTIDRAKSRRYLHVAAKTHASDVVYSRSTDSGKTWSNFSTVAAAMGGPRNLQMAADTRIVEGGVYLQYVDAGIGRVVWSKDHGDTFDKPINIGRVVVQREIFTLCGASGKGILLTAHHDHYIDQSFIKLSMLQDKSFLALPFPFKKVQNGFLLEGIATCRHTGNDEYSVLYTAVDAAYKVMWTAHGLLKRN